ncbi:hypothetical protein EVAR_10330_1 [Eumeta japonica]|uniref:Uncharacterized protein n=1 Tax=Eumeta variegata TaxID=151549 RepID=A0A4C1TES2_EUMVA|nr:hypothetical protein EVAR_10330_1 [Eumeta japonica]
MAVRIATGAVAHIGGSDGFAIGCRSRHNFPRNIGRRFLPYKATNLFPGRVLGRNRLTNEHLFALLKVASSQLEPAFENIMENQKQLHMFYTPNKAEPSHKN